MAKMMRSFRHSESMAVARILLQRRYTCCNNPVTGIHILQAARSFTVSNTRKASQVQLGTEFRSYTTSPTPTAGPPADTLSQENSSISNDASDGVQGSSNHEGAYRSNKSTANTNTMIEKISDTGLLNTLATRGLVADSTDATALDALLNNPSETQAVYCGFDPTAATLHVGNLVLYSRSINR